MDHEVPGSWDSNQEKAELLDIIYTTAIQRSIFELPAGIALSITTYVEDKVVWVAFNLYNIADPDVGTSFVTTDYTLGLDTADSNAATYVRRAADFINGKLTPLSI